MGRVVWSRELAARWPFLAAGFAALLLLFAACVLVYPRFLVEQALRRGPQQLPSGERVKVENEVRTTLLTTLLQSVGGVLLLAGAIATWRQLQVSREGQITDRFTKAIDQLGNKKSLAVRLGAIYALERIARDSERDQWRSWRSDGLRSPEPAWTEFKEEQQRNDDQADLKPPAPDIQAILTVLGRRTRTFGKGEDQRLNLMATDLLTFEARTSGAPTWSTRSSVAPTWSSRTSGAPT